MADVDVARRIALEIFNEGKVDLVDELFAADYVEHVPSPPGVPEGREGVKFLVRALHSAFPDLRVDILHQLRNADMDLLHIRATGTMQGDMMGMPATGKSATWEAMHLDRIRDGKVVEHWGVIDQLGMMQQVGLIPAPPGV